MVWGVVVTRRWLCRPSCFVLLTILSSIVMSACGSSGASADPDGRTLTAEFSVAPGNISAGALATFTWRTSNATSVTVSPNLNEEDDGTALPLSGSRTLAVSETTTYTLTAQGNGQTVQRQATVTVTPATPTVTLTAEPETIMPGQQATLRWTSENAQSLSIDKGIGTVTGPTGSVRVAPQATTTYTITASAAGKTSTAEATVTVTAAGQLAITLTSEPQSIAKGASSKLTWVSQNAVTVSISPGVGTVSLNGSVDVAPSATTTYTATATDGNGDTQVASATVTVLDGGGGLANLKHIIFFIQENRSFDNYFGMLGKYREREGLPNDVDGLDLNKALVDFWGHSVKPFHQRSVQTENLSPAWNESHFYANFQNGQFKMDKFLGQQNPSIPSTIDPHYTRTMGYYDERDIPFYYELATQFATSDRFFSSAMSGTVVNRAFLFSATSAGMIRPSDPFPEDIPTIFRRLSEAGISWRYYYQDGSVFLANYCKETNNDGKCDENDTGDWARYMKNVWHINNYFDILSRPTADRDLPQVIFIQHSSGEKGPETALDEHPGHHVQKGVAQAEKIVRALLNSTAWGSSVFILSHDEGGGLYDHVPPYAVTNPDGINPKFRDTDGGNYDNFTYSGFRVPLIVVSPWVKPNYVSHVNREFTSILKLIETRFNLPPLTQRDAQADDMAEMFDFSSPRRLTVPPLPAQPVNGVADITLEGDPKHPK